jgi:small subunit ribosomal protein S20
LANIQSQKKRNRQNEKRRLKNSQIRSSIRTSAKNVIKAIEANEKDNIPVLFKKFVKRIDTAAAKSIVHHKTAARKKSRLAKRVNAALS